MFVGAAEGFHFDFASKCFFLRQKDKATMHIKQMEFMMLTRTLAKVTWSIKERQGGERGKGTRRGGGRTSSKEVSTAKGIYLIMKGHH